MITDDTTDSNNVVMFPGVFDLSKARAGLSDETKKEITANKRNFVDAYIDNYAQGLIQRLAMQGFNVHTEEFFIHFMFSIEALKSCLYNTMTIEHPIQMKVNEMTALAREAEVKMEEEIEEEEEGHPIEE
tara:strand:- start:2390 stop:2779 length:390 start_codon:yes stop_codon:yes gene_type:complete